MKTIHGSAPSPPARLPTPDDLLRLNEVLQMTQLSKSAIYHYMQKCEFPPPLKLGGKAVRWRREVVSSWIERRTAASYRGVQRVGGGRV